MDSSKTPDLLRENEAYRRTSWNGISLTTPADWEATVSGKNHLHFEHHFSAVLEIRWEKILSKHTADSIDRSLKQIERLSGQKLCKTSLPAGVDKLLSDYETHCYSWNKEGNASLFFLYCTASSTLILLQFFNGAPAEHSLKSINNISLNDPTDNVGLWSIQDMQISIPTSYELLGYNLDAGLTRLSFTEKKSVLNIIRMAPAAIRLQQQSLDALFLTLLGEHDEKILSKNQDQLYYERQPSVAKQVIMRLKKKKPFCLATLWHNNNHDRIFGVIQESVHPLEHQLFDTICNSYEIYSPEKQ